MDIAQRRILRNELLDQIYEMHHADLKRPLELDISENMTEKVLALKYLDEKGYTSGFSYSSQLKKASVDKITVLGIDLIEGN